MSDVKRDYGNPKDDNDGDDDYEEDIPMDPSWRLLVHFLQTLDRPSILGTFFMECLTEYQRYSEDRMQPMRCVVISAERRVFAVVI